MKSKSDRRIWRPYTQEKTAPEPIEIARAEGAWLFTKSGRKIFDGISSWWLTTHGHAHPEIVAAIQQQVSRLDQVTFANFTHAPAEELADLLLRVTPSQLTRVFFSDNGSTSVEVALKMALQACAQKGFRERHKFLAFENAYHGDTVGAMSVSGDSPFTLPYKGTLFDVLRAKHPTRSSAPDEDYIKDFEKKIEEHHSVLAGVIVEPLIQGAGGMIVWPRKVVRRIAELCKKHDVPLIFDEVMTGFGRTGTLFAMDRIGIVPDFVCLSKGLTAGTLPMAVTLVQEEWYQAFLAEDRRRMFFHGHSFTGNPIACAAAVANLKLFQQPQTIQNLERIETFQLRMAETLKQDSRFADVRTCGTMTAVEIDSQNKGYLEELGGRVAAKALESDLFIRPLGNILYLLPPYCSTNEELESAWRIIRSSL